MEKKRGDTTKRKVPAETFINVVNNTLEDQYDDVRSLFGSLPPLSSKQFYAKDIKKHMRTPGLARIFHDLANALHWNQAVHFLLNYLEIYIPPPDVMQRVLDAMMMVDDWNIVGVAQMYMHQFVRTYVPNTEDMAEYYWEVLREEEVHQRRVCSPRDPCGSFINMLHQLDTELASVDEEKRKSSRKTAQSESDEMSENEIIEDPHDPTQSEPGVLDKSLLTGERMKKWWKYASSEKRIERIVSVFIVVVELFEIELATLKERLHKRKRKSLARPIISRLIWPNDSSGHPSSILVKTIINGMVICHRNNLNECLYLMEKLIMLIALVLPSSPLDEGEGFPPDSYERRVFAQHIADALVDGNLGDDRVDIAIARLKPDWLRLLVCSRVNKQNSKETMADMPQNVAQLTHILMQGLGWGGSGGSSESSSDSDEAGPSTRTHSQKKSGAKRSASGETKLHVLARTGNSKKLSEMLVKDGSKINIADHAGWTPMHEAVSRDNLECARVLCKHQMSCLHSGNSTKKLDKKSLAVNLHLKGGDMGLTPLHEAVMQNKKDMVELLLKFGGSDLLLDTTNAGLTAMDLTVNKEIVKILKKKKMEALKVEMNWIQEMDANEIKICHVKVDNKSMTLRTMLLHCYLESNSLFPILDQLRICMSKSRRDKAYVVKKLDYIEFSQNIKALQSFVRCARSHMSGKITFPEACLIVFLC